MIFPSASQRPERPALTSAATQLVAQEVSAIEMLTLRGGRVDGLALIKATLPGESPEKTQPQGRSDNTKLRAHRDDPVVRVDVPRRRRGGAPRPQAAERVLARRRHRPVRLVG